ncbi:MAG TPA: WD40 repeat domain-containing protein, partial [Planctomycetota bacterium]|nr:WD40 repeat domain-containing protein [Planctomycetota bacterium]
PDGRHALTACSNHDVSLWELASGKRLKVLKGHPDSVLAVAYSPDGRRAVSTDVRALVKVWDLATGKEIQSWKSEGIANGVAFSPDGRTVATASNDKTVSLWDATTGKERMVFSGHSEIVRGVAFLRDGSALLSASDDRTVRLWDLGTGKERREFSGHTDKVWSVAVSPDGKTAASGGADRRLRTWDLATGACLLTIETGSGQPGYLSFSPDGAWLLSDSLSTGAGIWDAQTGKKLRDFDGHRQQVYSAAFTPDGRRILTASFDRTHLLWDARTGERLTPPEGHPTAVSDVAWSPLREGPLSQSGDATLIQWNLGTGKAVRRSHEGIGLACSMSISPDGRTIAAGTSSFVDLWDADTLEAKPGFQVAGYAHSVAFSPDGKTILAAGGTGVTWRDRETGKVLQTLPEHPSFVRALAFTSDGKRAVISGEAFPPELWDLATGQRIHQMAWEGQTIDTLAVSPNGRYAVSGDEEGVVAIWDLEKGSLVRRLEKHEGQSCVAFSPDGQTILSGSWDKSAILWDVRTGRPLRTFTGHVGSVTAVAFSPGGTYIATGSSDTTVLVWRATGELSTEALAWAARWGKAPEAERTGMLQELLADLGSVDPPRGESARSRLDALGEESLPALTEAIGLTAPKAGFAEPELAKLLAGLDDDDPQARQKSREELRSKGAGLLPWVERQLRQGLALSAEARSSLTTLRDELAKDPSGVGDLARLRILLLLTDRLPAPDALRGIRMLAQSAEPGLIEVRAQRLVAAFENPEAAAESALRSAEQAQAREEFDTAARLASDAEGLARKAGLKAVAERAVRLQENVRSLAADLNRALEAEKILAAQPSDPAANLTLGLYFCFVKHDWDRGVRRLSKSGEPPLRAAALGEAAGALDGPAKLALGDRWWDAAASPAIGRFSKACRARAGTWYSQALAGLEGRDHARAEDRLRVIASEAEIDLLSLIDLAQDSVHGRWVLEDGALVCSEKAFPARIQIPYVPPDEYDLTVVAERTDGQESINLGVIGGGRPFQVVIDGWPTLGFVSTLWSLDGMDGVDNESTHRGMVLRNGKPSTIVCSVRKTGVKLTVDGAVLFDWKGDYGRLANPLMVKIPNSRVFSIGCYDVRYRFSTLRLLPVSGTGKALR